MVTFLTHFTYWGIVLVLLASGLGLPLPEDLPLLFGGYLCGIGSARLELMIPMCFMLVVGADCMIYTLGRKYGHHVPRLPIVRRYLTEARLAQAEKAFHGHGGKTLFTARFLPGLRAPIFFTAGVFKIPFWKMLVFDGSAALISVPTLVLIAWFFADYFARVRKLSALAQFGILAVVLLVVGGVIGWKAMRRRRKIKPATTTPREQGVGLRV